MLKQRRAAITSRFCCRLRPTARPLGQDRAVHEQPAQRIRDIDHVRIHQEFLQIDPHLLGGRGVGRAQIDEQQAFLLHCESGITQSRTRRQNAISSAELVGASLAGASLAKVQPWENSVMKYQRNKETRIAGRAASRACLLLAAAWLSTIRNSHLLKQTEPDRSPDQAPAAARSESELESALPPPGSKPIALLRWALVLVAYPAAL